MYIASRRSHLSPLASPPLSPLLPSLSIPDCSLPHPLPSACLLNLLVRESQVSKTCSAHVRSSVMVLVRLLLLLLGVSHVAAQTAAPTLNLDQVRTQVADFLQNFHNGTLGTRAPPTACALAASISPSPHWHCADCGSVLSWTSLSLEPCRIPRALSTTMRSLDTGPCSKLPQLHTAECLLSLRWMFR